MKIFITGSESFIGGFLWDKLAAAGHELSGVDLAPPTRPGGIQMDLRDPEIAARIPEGAAVIHLAAVSTDPLCKGDPLAAFDVNISGTISIARAAAARKASQLIFASTEWVYGDVADGGAQTEDLPIDVTAVQGPYAASKIVGETVLRLSGIQNVTVLRFGIVYGPRIKNWSAVEALVDKVLKDSPISVGSLATSRRFINVGDLCEGIQSALGRTGFEIFNLTADSNITLSAVVESAGRILRKDPKPVETAPNHPSIRNPPNDKARSALDWAPRISLETGIREVLAFWAQK
jgi:UDP-glucose 4-epimerase